MFGLKTRSTHKFLRDRIIFVGLPVSDEIAADALDALKQLEKKGGGPITIYINSPGGAALACEKIICGMDASALEIRTHCIGLAAGGAAHIFLAGHRRFAKSDARVLFTPFYAGDFIDTAEIEAVKQRFVARTSVALGVSGEVVKRWMAEEACFSGPDLIHGRIVHQIV